MVRLSALVLILQLATACLRAQSGLVSPTEFSARADKAAFTLLDVRTEEEWNAGHLDGAVRIDRFADDFEAELKKLDKSKPVLVYCAAGGRSSDAYDMLVSLGFKQVLDLDGGMRGWRKAGLPVVK
jgi:phage shock protein E